MLDFEITMNKASCFYNQYCLTVGFISLLLFMYGFFPIKSSTSTFSSKADLPSTLQDLKFRKDQLYSGSVGRTVLMVIDGLRVDFVTEDHMPYTWNQVARGSRACQLTARATAPTVTLPRIKAIVTGSVSSFIDVVLNFGTVELTSDNIIQQAARTKNIVFFGDDIWTKLFPRHFIRSDGTSSFFVNDYTEVDINVTRHLDAELRETDWGLMVLHYLGLDHIGHIEGPSSPLIKPKLREMDQIIAKLHGHLETQDRGLLLICGDHGMKDSGSHGGVSLSEILVPVVTLGLACPNHHKEEILQVDLATTLSVLWGAPIPSESVGVAATALLGHLSPVQHTYALLYNAHQLAANFLRNGGQKEHEGFCLMEEAKQFHYQWLTNGTSATHQDVDALYYSSLLSMSRFLTEVLANYDMMAIVIALALLFQVVSLMCLRLLSAQYPHSSVCSAVSLVILIASALASVCRLTSLCSMHLAIYLFTGTVFVSNGILLRVELRECRKLKLLPDGLRLSWEIILPLGTVLFSLSLLSSSLVEEEHQLWYFLWCTVATLRLPQSPFRWACALALHRLLRSMNQTGDHWAHLPDLSDWLIRSENKLMLSALCTLGLMGVCWCCARLKPPRFIVAFSIGAAICIYLQKAASGQVASWFTVIPHSAGGISEARLCWLLIIILLFLGRSLDCLIGCWMLASSLLLRPYNTVLVPALFIVSQILTQTSSNKSSTVLHHWVGAVFFFYQGNSNSLASVDLSAGYVGLQEYNVTIVAGMLFTHTYSMPVLAYLLNLKNLLKTSKNRWSNIISSCEITVFLLLLHIFACLAAVTLHRYHLFVWTVFSPKLLYLASQSLVYLLLVSITNIYIFISSK